MSLITRTYSFTDGTTAYGSQVESEIANIVTTLNNLDSATSSWDIVKVVNGTSTPLIADNSSGSNSVADFRVNGVSKVTVTSAGVLTTTNGITNSGAAIAAGTQKITGLANGTASTDAAAFGQVPVFTDWASFTPTLNNCGSAAISFFWRQAGNSIEIRGAWQNGTTAAATFSITGLPNSTTIAHTKLPSTGTTTQPLVGTAVYLNANGSGSGTQVLTDIIWLFTDGSTNGIFASYTRSGGGTWSKLNASTLFTSNSYVTCQFSYPI